MSCTLKKLTKMRSMGVVALGSPPTSTSGTREATKSGMR
jgi:hypothetical protein